MPQSTDTQVARRESLTNFEKKYGLAALVARTSDNRLKHGFSIGAVESIQGPTVRQVGLVKILYLSPFMGDRKATIVKYRSSEVATALAVLQAVLNLGWPLIYSPDSWQIFINEKQITLFPHCKNLNFQISLVDNTKSALDSVNEVCIFYTATPEGAHSFDYRKGLLLYLQTPEFPDDHYLSREESRWWAVAKGLESELSEDL